MVGSNKLPEVKKRTILQQVMKPKDWVMLGILILFSAVCWLWVLNAYQKSVDINSFVNVGSFIDKITDLS